MNEKKKRRSHTAPCSSRISLQLKMNNKSFSCGFLLALVISVCLLGHAHAADDETDKRQLYTAAAASLRGKGALSGVAKEGIGAAIAAGANNGVGPWKDLLASGRVIHIGNLINPPRTRCPCSCADPVGREPTVQQHNNPPLAVGDNEIVETVVKAVVDTVKETVVEERRATGVLVQLLPSLETFPGRTQICMRMSMAMVLVDLEPNNFGCVSTCA
jgi:hypothetical protein